MKQTTRRTVSNDDDLGGGGASVEVAVEVAYELLRSGRVRASAIIYIYIILYVYRTASWPRKMYCTEVDEVVKTTKKLVVAMPTCGRAGGGEKKPKNIAGKRWETSLKNRPPTCAFNWHLQSLHRFRVASESHGVCRTGTV